MTLAPGSRLGPYEVLDLLGAGGMGEVYRARDSRLGREIAVKVPPERLARDPTARARFDREARAAAALTHPNILDVHDVGEAGGTLYVVTELLVGETLRERLVHGPLRWDRAVEIAVAVAEGLAAAHEAGLVHRDVKPENVFLTADGRVKVLDFGLAAWDPDTARASQAATITEENVVVGTAAYIAPERLRGGPADARGDIFALGCVLHEMLAGERAFPGSSAAEVWSAILTSEPRSLRQLAPEAPEELVRLVERCLAKSPALRFQSARDLTFALHLAGGAHAPPPVRPQLRLGPVLAALAALAVLAAVALRARAPQVPSRGSVAVLPFICGEKGAEYLGDGVAENLINRLTRLSRLRVAARASAFALRGEADPRKAGRQLGVDAVVTGHIARQGDSVVVQVDLVDVAGGAQIWGERYGRPFADVAAVEDEIAREIADGLGARLTGDEQRDLSRRGTASPEAYDLTLRGRFQAARRDEDGLTQALRLYRQALEKDPRYASAWCGLADAYDLAAYYGAAPPSEVIPKAKEAALQALALDERAPEAHVSLADILYQFDRDWPGAEREFRRALALGPNGAAAHHWYSNYLSAASRFPESMAEIEKARAADPLNPLIANDLALAHYWAGRVDVAAVRLAELARTEPSFPLVHFYLALVRGHQGHYAEAEESLGRAGVSPDTLGLRGWIAARAGRTDEARRSLASLEALAGSRFVSAFPAAFVRTGLGEVPAALDGLEKAFEEKAGRLVYLKVERAFDPLRGEARFRDLVRRLGIPGGPSESGPRARA